MSQKTVQKKICSRKRRSEEGEQHMIIAVEEYETIPILYSENDSGIIKWDKKKKNRRVLSQNLKKTLFRQHPAKLNANSNCIHFSIVRYIFKTMG